MSREEGQGEIQSSRLCKVTFNINQVTSVTRPTQRRVLSALAEALGANSQRTPTGA